MWSVFNKKKVELKSDYTKDLECWFCAKTINIIRTNHLTYGVLRTQCILKFADKIEPIVSCFIPCSTNHDGVHTPESVVHTVLFGLH